MAEFKSSLEVTLRNRTTRRLGDTTAVPECVDCGESFEESGAAAARRHARENPGHTVYIERVLEEYVRYEQGVRLAAPADDGTRA